MGVGGGVLPISRRPVNPILQSSVEGAGKEGRDPWFCWNLHFQMGDRHLTGISEVGGIVIEVSSLFSWEEGPLPSFPPTGPAWLSASVQNGRA